MEEAPVDLLELPSHLRREAVDFLIEPDDASPTNWILPMSRSATTSK
jgi:hypothetical protein